MLAALVTSPPGPFAALLLQELLCVPSEVGGEGRRLRRQNRAFRYAMVRYNFRFTRHSSRLTSLPGAFFLGKKKQNPLAVSSADHKYWT